MYSVRRDGAGSITHANLICGAINKFDTSHTYYQHRRTKHTNTLNNYLLHTNTQQSIQSSRIKKKATIIDLLMDKWNSLLFSAIIAWHSRECCCCCCQCTHICVCMYYVEQDILTTAVCHSAVVMMKVMLLRRINVCMFFFFRFCGAIGLFRNNHQSHDDQMLFHSPDSRERDRVRERRYKKWCKLFGTIYEYTRLNVDRLHYSINSFVVRQFLSNLF